MKNWPFLLGCLVVVIILGILFWPRFKEWQATQEPVVVSNEPAFVPPQPAIKHPISQIEALPSPPSANLDLDRPLPELTRSDARMQELLALLFAEQHLGDHFLLEHFIERFVVMVDNLPRDQLSATHRPFKKIPGSFKVSGTPDNLTIAPANYQRYTALLDLLRKVDCEQAIAVYVRLYPLFQEAYEKLGYTGLYFNDRLIEVIDHLLAAPLISGPTCLTKPKYYYEYADPDLEALSAGHKIMLRIGPDHADRVKTLLRAYRRELLGQPATSR